MGRGEKVRGIESEKLTRRMPKVNPAHSCNPVSQKLIVRTENLHTHTRMRTPTRNTEGGGRGPHVVQRITHNPLLMKNFDSFLEQRVTEKCFYSWLETHCCWLTDQLKIGEKKKVNFVSVRATSNTTSECQILAHTVALKWGWEWHSATPLERVAVPPGTTSVQALQKTNTSWPPRSPPAPRTNLSLLVKKGQSTGVKCKAAATMETWNHRGGI